MTIVILRSVSEGSNIYMSSDGRDCARKGLGDDGAGFLAGGDQGVAKRNPCQQRRDVGGRNYFQECIGGIVLQTTNLTGGVVKCQTFPCAERPNGRLVKPLLARNAEMRLFTKVYQPHYPPEVVDPVGVVERHAPAMRLGRETAEEQDAGVLWQERWKRVLFGVHVNAKIANNYYCL